MVTRLAQGRTYFVYLSAVAAWAFASPRLGVPLWAAIAAVVASAFAVGYVIEELSTDA